MSKVFLCRRNRRIGTEQRSVPSDKKLIQHGCASTLCFPSCPISSLSSSSVPASSLNLPPPFPLFLFPCFSQRGPLSIQSQYALSAGLLNSNLKAGSRLTTGKLSTGVPAPNTLQKFTHINTHTHTYPYSAQFRTKRLPRQRRPLVSELQGGLLVFTNM